MPSHKIAIVDIQVVTGEHCQNRVMFKQLIQANAIGICQIDNCRVGGVNEILAIMSMAPKFTIPVCPHAGVAGLCKCVQHLSMIDHMAASGSLENRAIEYVDHLHEYLFDPVVINNDAYIAPEHLGYSITMKPTSLKTYHYPNGKIWIEELQSN